MGIIAGTGKEQRICGRPRDRVDDLVVALDPCNQLAAVPVPDAHRAILAATEHQPFVDSAKRRPQDVVALFMATVFALRCNTWLGKGQVVALYAWLGHGDVCQQELAVFAKSYGSDGVVAVDDSHVWTRDVTVLLLSKFAESFCRLLCLLIIDPLQIVSISHLAIFIVSRFEAFA